MQRQPYFRLARDTRGHLFLEVALRGQMLHGYPLLNKGSAFPDEERAVFGLHGLLPPGVATMEEQIERVLGNYQRRDTDIERYMDLMALMDRNETLFYRLLVDRLEELLPIVYTPTVGEACREFGHIFRRGRGLYVTAEDLPRIDEVLGNWPLDDVAVIVVTDGERILGLGDLGSGGMGIPIGKISLYVAAAGIHPARTLPVCLDVGTDNEELLADPLYLGVQRRRLRGEGYDELLDAFMAAVRRRFPRALVQFEDFATANAIRLLARYRDGYLCFNDDIQGTAAVTVAGVFAAMERLGGRLAEQRFVMAGAGESATGIGGLLVSALREEGVSERDALARLWFVDSRGLVFEGRGPLEPHKVRFARSREEAGALRSEEGGVDLECVVRGVRPTVLVGASGQPGLFTERVIGAMAEGIDRPLLFVLSNPTSKAECTPEQAITWCRGRALVATGSPFAPVRHEGATQRIGQANNVFVFPGVGLGLLACGASRVTDGLFLAAARTLAGLAPADALYPAIGDIRRISREVALAVAREAVREGVAPDATESELEAKVMGEIWDPAYVPYHVMAR